MLLGEPGVGKTAVLDAGPGDGPAAGFRVLRASGVQFEFDVTYSGLNQILFPLYPSIAGLPPAQPDALDVRARVRGRPRTRAAHRRQRHARAAASRDGRGTTADRGGRPPMARPRKRGRAWARRAPPRGEPAGLLAAARTGEVSLFESVGLPEHELRTARRDRRRQPDRRAPSGARPRCATAATRRGPRQSARPHRAPLCPERAAAFGCRCSPARAASQPPPPGPVRLVGVLAISGRAPAPPARRARRERRPARRAHHLRGAGRDRRPRGIGAGPTGLRGSDNAPLMFATRSSGLLSLSSRRTTSAGVPMLPWPRCLPTSPTGTSGTSRRLPSSRRKGSRRCSKSRPSRAAPRRRDGCRGRADPSGRPAVRPGRTAAADSPRPHTSAPRARASSPARPCCSPTPTEPIPTSAARSSPLRPPSFSCSTTTAM